MTIIKRQIITNPGYAEEKQLSYIAGGNIKWCSLFGKQFKKLNIKLPYDLAIPLLFTQEK